MDEYLYHGTIYSGLTELEARSKLHNTDQRVVYLTDNIPYALLYIWDENHNDCSEKHVTGWVRNGVAYMKSSSLTNLKHFIKAFRVTCMPSKTMIGFKSLRIEKASIIASKMPL